MLADLVRETEEETVTIGTVFEVTGGRIHEVRGFAEPSEAADFVASEAKLSRESRLQGGGGITAVLEGAGIDVGRTASVFAAILNQLERAAGAAVWGWNLDKDAIHWSEQHWNLVGEDPQERTVDPNRLLDYVHPGDRVLLGCAIEATLRGESVPPVSYRLVRADGSIIRASSFSVAVRSESGEIAGVLGATTDETAGWIRARTFQTHAQIRRALTAWDEGEAGPAELLEVSGSGVGAIAAGLWMIDGDDARCFAVWGRPDVDLAELERVTRELRLRMGEGLIGRSWARQQPLHVSDLPAAPDFRRQHEARVTGARRALVVPAMNRGRVMGIVELFLDRSEWSEEALIAFAQMIVEPVGAALARHRTEIAGSPLTPREHEVIRDMAQGRTADEIAGSLMISPTTVRTHQGHLYEKLGVNERAAAVAEAMRLGLLD